MKTTDSPQAQELYHEGDTVPVEYQLYPGPRDFKTTGKVVRCLSPTYYEIEYMDHRQRQVTKRYRRSQLR